MENYVKMLRAPGAEWIQLRWKKLPGDRFLCRGGIYIRNYGYLQDPCLNHDCLYLPSIEDYMGMVEGNLHEQRAKFFLWSIQTAPSMEYIYQFKTWPELMLAFVQHEIKSLSWDGEGWR